MSSKEQFQMLKDTAMALVEDNAFVDSDQIREVIANMPVDWTINMKAVGTALAILVREGRIRRVYPVQSTLKTNHSRFIWRFAAA